MKKEVDFQTLFRHYIRAHPFNISSHIELKDSRGKDYIAFSEVKQQQIDSALASNSDIGNLIRIEVGTTGAPDFAYYRNSPAYIVIRFPTQFSIISIGTFMLEKERSRRKSLTSSRAQEISVKTVSLRSLSSQVKK